jgi:hypothetical protein
MSLPPGWEDMSLDALWHRLNDLGRNPTSQASIEALMYSLRERGLNALTEHDCQRRLSELHPDQLDSVITRLTNMRVRYSPITDELITRLKNL